MDMTVSGARLIHLIKTRKNSHDFLTQVKFKYFFVFAYCTYGSSLVYCESIYGTNACF